MGDEDIAAPDGIGCAGMAQGVGLEVAVAGALVEAVSTAGAAQGSWRGCACRDGESTDWLSEVLLCEL